MKPQARLLIAAGYFALVVWACVATLADVVYDRGDGLQFMWLGLLALPWTVVDVGLGALTSFAPDSIHHVVGWVLLPAGCLINFVWLARPAVREIKTS
ncbi:MAG TPA: hypothetical protein VE441_07555 [Mycobacterium sp.]|nr:hypothetical protein [Mycobacterium sp.]